MQFEKIFQFFKARRPEVKAEEFLKRWGAWGVAVIAVIYYAQYFRSGLNLGGEGGTVAVVAMRLMEGQRPIVDTFLGYNVMWFYPVAWLFELTGPDYIALRIFFFAICTITGVLAFFVVRRVTGSGWFATLAALGPVLIPGMLFRNYMGFLAVLNMLMLLQAYVFEQRTPWRQRLWMTGAGAALGLTYLVRIDLGTFFTVITLGLVVLYPWGKRGEFGFRLRQAVWGLFLAVVMFGATHAPFYRDAVRRGYEEAFVSQYTGWINLVRYLASLELGKKPEPPPVVEKAQVPVPAAPPEVEVKPPQPAAPAATPVPVAIAKAEAAAPAASPGPEETKARDLESEDYLQKRSWGDFFKGKSFYDRAFVLITYYDSGGTGALAGAGAGKFSFADGGAGGVGDGGFGADPLSAVFFLSTGHAASFRVHGAVFHRDGLRGVGGRGLDAAAAGGGPLVRGAGAFLRGGHRAVFLPLVSQGIGRDDCGAAEEKIGTGGAEWCAGVSEKQRAEGVAGVLRTGGAVHPAG